MSVISFLKIISSIKKSRKLVKYSNHKGLNERMPNYSVKMGFGLHVGWAIEGAIGSFYKIDASYLSPNVNMASRLEAATK
jgi:class 3 adenylate cyclase